jgi:hypothetical protein
VHLRSALSSKHVRELVINAMRVSMRFTYSIVLLFRSVRGTLEEAIYHFYRSASSPSKFYHARVS